MKFILTALLAISLCVSAFAQNTLGIKGTTVDSVSKAKLNASITVLNAKDSILQKFTYADDNGAFAINGLPAGKYFLLITYPQYEDKIRPFTLDAAKPVNDLGNINMFFMGNQLAEVKVKAPVQEIKIKGDTLEFNAKAYVIQPNAKVEDLLKQIPGIQIDKNGKITMNGEPVPKMLVDGEEFFGDDPTLITQNLRADMVSSVQIYDKKSDQAAFTGIDDGQKTKTINIKLKEDKKKGLFGKVSAGEGSGGYHEAQAIINKFAARSKFAAYGTLANDGKTGLGIADNSKLGSSTAVQIGDTGGVLVTGGGDDDLDADGGNYNGNGLPVAKAAGAHFDTKVKNDATLNTNYKIGALDVDGEFTSSTQLNIPGSSQDIEIRRNFRNEAARQKADASYFTKLDTSSTLKVDAYWLDKHLVTRNSALTNITNMTNDSLLSRETKRLFYDYKQKSTGISALYTKKFRKPRRTFSWNVSETYAENNSTGYLYSDIYSPNTPTDEITDQYKVSLLHNTNVSSNMTYTEPLSKYWSLQVNYGLGINNSVRDNTSYDKSSSGQYDNLNTLYSNNFKINQVTNQVGAIFNYRKDKALFNFGTRTSFVDLDQLERFTNKTYKRSFINWNPQVVYQYQMSSQQVIQVYYAGSTQQPTTDQLQPVLSNTNPLQIIIGNADLKPAYTHYFQGTYRTQQIISRQSFMLNGSYNFVDNQISSRSTIDPRTGKTTTQAINLTNLRPDLITLTASGSRRIAGTEIDMSLSLGGRRSTSYNYVNTTLNELTNITYNVGLGMQTVKFQKYEFALGLYPTLNLIRNSSTPLNNNNTPGANVNSRLTLYLPGKFILASDLNYMYRAKTQSIDALNMTILNASLSKTFFKDQNLKLSLSGNNLLDANPSLVRSVTSTSILQSNYNTIMHYFLLSVSWDFTKFGTTAIKN